MSVQPTAELKLEIKNLIIEACNFNDIKPEQIPDDASLFEENGVIELDSVDALEVVVALQRKYGVRIDNQNLARFIVRSVNTIAEFIAKEQSQKEGTDN